MLPSPFLSSYLEIQYCIVQKKKSIPKIRLAPYEYGLLKAQHYHHNVYNTKWRYTYLYNHNVCVLMQITVFTIGYQETQQTKKSQGRKTRQASVELTLY